MVLGFGQSKGASPAKRPEDVASLIAKKNYAKAIELLKQQLAASRHDSRLRLQLADLLVLAGKGREAVTILLALADEFAREGFAAKAISVLKKVQKLDPLQRDVDARLASLIQEKQKQATVAPPPASMPEFGIEEIGFEPPPSSPAPEPAFVPELEAEPAAEIGLKAPPPPPPAPLPPPVEDRDFEEAEGALPAESDAPVEGELTLEAIASAEPELTLEPEAAAEPVLELEPEAEVAAEPELTLEPEVEAEPMTETAFADELMSLVEGAFREDATPSAPAAAPGGSQIVVSPLFKDFSVDEMVAVIQGLNLIAFEPGDIILTEGDAGDSLYMLTSGTVKAVKRNAAGRQVAIGEMAEGAFFGEISILTGRPRTATVVATSRCELLELDRATLDSIVASHPHVRQVLEQFSKERLANLSRR